jgi:CxxC-x17-CxxC domain-containing protein
MEPQFVDRILTCSDCHGEFIFTAGEQLFFFDKQFKNDPKRCKPCKSRRSGLSAAANGGGPAAAGLSRTETRTECSECGIQTTVPFKPTQGRPVLCRQCFQAKARAAAAPPVRAAITEPVPAPPALAAAPLAATPLAVAAPAATASALADASMTNKGLTLSPDAAVLAAASMASASPQSSISTAADLASITPGGGAVSAPPVGTGRIPAALVAAAANSESHAQELHAVAADANEA